MTKLTEKEPTLMPMELITMVIGSMISSMGGAWSHGLMARNTKVNIKMARKMGEESLHLPTVPSMMENSRRMRSVVKASITGRTANTSKVNGREIRCMAMVCSPGRMANAMKASS
jgi:hypothetical protein